MTENPLAEMPLSAIPNHTNHTESRGGLSITTFIIGVVILIIISLGVVAEYGRVRKGIDKERYDDAMKIVMIRYSAIVKHIESGEYSEDSRLPADWPKVEAALEVEKNKFQQKWGETFKEYLERGGDADYERMIGASNVIPVDE